MVLYTETHQMLRGRELPESPPLCGMRGTKYVQTRKVLSSEMLRKGTEAWQEREKRLLKVAGAGLSQ